MTHYVPIFQDDELGIKIELFYNNNELNVREPYIVGRFKLPLELYEKYDKQLHRIIVLVAQCGGYIFADAIFADIITFEDDILINNEHAEGMFTYRVFGYLDSLAGIYHLHMSIDRFISKYIEIKNVG